MTIWKPEILDFMNLLRWTAACCTLFLVGSVVCVSLERGSAGGEAGELEKSVTASEPEKSEPATAPDSAQQEKLLRAEWYKNITQWKQIEMDPKEPADNSFCLVCHANYETEKLVKVHRREGVGCETCHGISDKHSEDEDSLIPPDVIFARSSVGLFCLECHDKDELIESDKDHKKFFDAKEPPQDPEETSGKKTCTNCHAMKHELKNRTRRWNKETREVEWFDGVRMMQERDDE